jgi:hypothetical protein
VVKKYEDYNYDLIAFDSTNTGHRIIDMAPALAQDVLDFSSGSLRKSTDQFHQLVEDLSRILGPSSGLTSNDVDVKHLEELMVNYISKDREWQRYAFADLSRGYTRNLVDEGNGKSNLVRDFSVRPVSFKLLLCLS